MTAKLLEVTPGIDPWFVASVEFDEMAKTLAVRIDFKAGSGFAVSGHEGSHGLHDTVIKTYRCWRCVKYVEMACSLADHLDVTALAIEETSRAEGHSYVTLAADADARRMLFVTEGFGATMPAAGPSLCGRSDTLSQCAPPP